MLTGLTIKNVVLIDQLSVGFESGFCALTGETGAGKSILLDSLGLALGARSESSLVRKGTVEASVSATFEINNNHPVCSILHNSNIAIEKGEALILRRIVKADGGSRAFINDLPVSAGLLRQVGETLVEIHGQFETQGLLDPKTHRAMVDEYAGIDGGKLAGLWNDWKEAQVSLASARAKMEKARQDEAYLRQAVEDLDALEPKEGEEGKLASLREKLMKRDQIMESLSGAYESLSEAENTMGTGWRVLEKAGAEAQPLMDGLGRASAEIQEVLAQIQIMSTDLQNNEYSLEDIDDRLFALRGQARKHNCTVDELSAVRDDLAGQLNMIEAQDDTLAALIKQTEEARALYMKFCEAVRAKRQKCAQKLDKLVAKELPPLKLEKAQFVTQVEALDENAWGPQGMDSVRFLVATNPGVAPGPLHKIASGGEMARFMLALKVVLAEIGAAGSLIFDEVDSGIGGATASAVGERLAKLALSKQILVVTHSPQVAARAAYHWIVLKDGTKDVKTTVIPLGEVMDRREEIARMLSGAEISAEARAAADKLLETGT